MAVQIQQIQMKYHHMWNIFIFCIRIIAYMHAYISQLYRFGINGVLDFRKQWNTFEIVYEMCVNAALSSILCKMCKMLSQMLSLYMHGMYGCIWTFFLHRFNQSILFDSLLFFSHSISSILWVPALWTVCWWHVMLSFTFDALHLISSWFQSLY